MATLHTVPVGDLIQHEQSEDCPCGPAVQLVDAGPDEPDGWLVVHHSLDGREAHE